MAVKSAALSKERYAMRVWAMIVPMVVWVSILSSPTGAFADSEEVVTEAPLGVVLEGAEPGNEVALGDLTWTVTNTAKKPLLISSTLVSEGLIVMRDSRPLDSFKLEANESESIVVFADELPIQSATGAGVFWLELEVVPLDDPTRSVRVISREWYYRHTSDYCEVVVFDESVLLDAYGGTIFEDFPQSRDYG